MMPLSRNRKNENASSKGVGHKSKSSSMRKHYDKNHAGAGPEDLFSCFRVLKRCKNKFDCLVNEILYIKQLRLPLNMQTDSIHAKVVIQLFSFMQI